MIVFEFNGQKGRIYDNFEIFFPEDLVQNTLKNMLDLMLLDFQPYSGDPFLAFAEKMRAEGYKILKVKPQAETGDAVY